MEAKAKQRLGDRCTRCRISYPTQWDHINDDPVRTPGVRRTGVKSSEYPEIKRIAETGRSDRLQLLCPNCNWMKHHNRQKYDRPPEYGPLA